MGCAILYSQPVPIYLVDDKQTYESTLKNIYGRCQIPTLQHLGKAIDLYLFCHFITVLFLCQILI